MSMAASFLDAPIKRKLMLIVLLTSGLGLLLISLILTAESRGEWRKRTVSDMVTNAKVIGASASSALLFDDADTATKTLAALSVIPDIVDVVIYDKTGKTFARFIAPQHLPGAFHPSVKPGAYLFDTERLVVSEPIRFKGEVLGNIYLESDLRGLRADLLEGISIIFITAFAVFLLTALIFGRLQKTIVAPIVELADGMRKVSAEQDYTVRVAVHSRDEVGILADTFNTMLERIQRRDTELAQHREHLEEEVLQRTASLAESEARFRKLFENSNDAIFIHTVDGLILDANSQAENLMGYPVAVLKTMPIPALHPTEELETSKKAFEETISKGYTKFESRFRHSSGGLFDVEISSRMVDREKGIIQGTVRDITERKQMDEALRSAHEELLKKSMRLEKFQQVTVGREMRVVEMKNEVNGLLERLGEPRKYVEVDGIEKKGANPETSQAASRHYRLFT